MSDSRERFQALVRRKGVGWTWYPEKTRFSFVSWTTAFFVPTEGAEGKRTIIEGEAFYDTLTVDMRRHYAQDAGASEEEIAAIIEPELKLAFMATGVMIEEE